MKLFTSGVKVPPLGSIQDRMLRKYAIKEADLELQRMKFQMFTTLTNLQTGSDSKRIEYSKTIQDQWRQFIGLLYNVELPTDAEEEARLLEYYERVVSKLRPEIRKDKTTGTLSVSGLSAML